MFPRRKPGFNQMKHTCQIYVLVNNNQEIDYVGRSRRLKLRLQEHRTVLGYRPLCFVVDSCHENCREVENSWIEFFKQQGIQLRNIYSGQGPHFLPETLKQQISARQKGKVVTAETRRKMSEWQKGKPKNFSEAGLARLKETGRKSRGRFASLSVEKQEEIRQCSLQYWASRTPEEMLAWSKQSTQNNLRRHTGF